MDHSTHGGMSMDMGSSGIFRPRNLALAHSFWYIVVGVLLFGFFLKGLRVLDSWSRSVAACYSIIGLDEYSAAGTGNGANLSKYS